MANFYMTVGTGAEVDIESTYGIRVTSVRGLNPPQPKEIFTRDWATENGVDVYIPDTRKIKSSEIIMTIYVKGDTSTAMAKYKVFCDFLLASGLITYRDTVQSVTVNIIYNSNKPAWYNLVSETSLLSEITFINPTGAIS